MTLVNVISYLIMLSFEMTDIKDLSNLTEKDKFNLHHGFVVENDKWPSGEIPFRLDNQISGEELNSLLQSMYLIENSTCIRFIPIDEQSDRRYLWIKKKDTDGLCYADVGLESNQTFEKRLVLDSICFVYSGAILHELLHVIGFDHHQTRSDRDKYVTIHYPNLDRSDRVQFDKRINELNDSIEYLTPFDFDSVMLYSNYTLSNNGYPTMTINPGFDDKFDLLVNKTISSNDIVLVNKFYDCSIDDFKLSRIFFNNLDQKSLESPMRINYNEIKISQADLGYYRDSFLRICLSSSQLIFTDWLSIVGIHILLEGD